MICMRNNIRSFSCSQLPTWRKMKHSARIQSQWIATDYCYFFPHSDSILLDTSWMCSTMRIWIRCWFVCRLFYYYPHCVIFGRKHQKTLMTSKSMHTFIWHPKQQREKKKIATGEKNETSKNNLFANFCIRHAHSIVRIWCGKAESMSIREYSQAASRIDSTLTWTGNTINHFWILLFRWICLVPGIHRKLYSFS